MAASSLVGEIHRLSKSIGKVLGNLPGIDPLGSESRKSTTAFLFEVRVLWILLLELERAGWNIQTHPKSGRFTYARAPAKKGNRSYYKISNGPHTFHLCHGTMIVDRHDQPRAPDISLQSSDAGDDPTYEHVLAFWDMKWRGRLTPSSPSEFHSDDTVTDQEFARFALLRKWLEPPAPGSASDVLDDWPPAFEVVGIITNGRMPTEPESVFLECQVSAVEHMASVEDQTQPTRTEHIKHRRARGKI